MDRRSLRFEAFYGPKRLTLELWDGEPPDDRDQWEVAYEAEVTVGTRGIDFDDSPSHQHLDAFFTIPATAGRNALRLVGRGVPAPGATGPAGHYRLQMWLTGDPVPSVETAAGEASARSAAAVESSGVDGRQSRLESSPFPGGSWDRAEERPWERYAWLSGGDREAEHAQGPWVPEAFCVLLTRCSPERLLEVYGAAREPVVRGTWEDVEAAWDDPPIDPDTGEPASSMLQLLEIHGWTVAVEDGGYLGAQDEVAAALSAEGRSAAYYVSVNADMRVVLAEGGAVVRAFDPLLYWEDVGEPLALEAGLPFGEEDAPAPALAFVAMERWTGVSLDLDSLFGASGAFHWYRLP